MCRHCRIRNHTPRLGTALSLLWQSCFLSFCWRMPTYVVQMDLQTLSFTPSNVLKPVEKGPPHLDRFSWLFGLFVRTRAIASICSPPLCLAFPAARPPLPLIHLLPRFVQFVGYNRCVPWCPCLFTVVVFGLAPEKRVGGCVLSRRRLFMIRPGLFIREDKPAATPRLREYSLLSLSRCATQFLLRRRPSSVGQKNPNPKGPLLLTVMPL